MWAPPLRRYARPPSRSEIRCSSRCAIRARLLTLSNTWASKNLILLHPHLVLGHSLVELLMGFFLGAFKILMHVCPQFHRLGQRLKTKVDSLHAFVETHVTHIVPGLQ